MMCVSVIVELAEIQAFKVPDSPSLNNLLLVDPRVPHSISMFGLLEIARYL